MLTTIFIYKNDLCFFNSKSQKTCHMSKDLQEFHSQKTTQLISSLVNIIHKNCIQFGNKCRSYIKSQHQQGLEMAHIDTLKDNYNPTNHTLNANTQPQKNNTLTIIKEYKPVFKEPKFTRNLNGQEVPFMAKRPRNAYNLFVQSESVKIKQQNPHMRAPDIVRIAAERYNNMNQEQKRPYLQKFEEAKRIYDRQAHQLGGRMPIPRKRGRGSRYDYSLKS